MNKPEGAEDSENVPDFLLFPVQNSNVSVSLCVQGMMGGLGWTFLLLLHTMLPVASQKPPGLNVGVIMGQTRFVSDQELRPPRRPDDALDISVVALRINQTDPKSVITQVRHTHTHAHTRPSFDPDGVFVPRCVSSCRALVSTASCSPTALTRRPFPKSWTSCLFRHSFQLLESTEAPL